MWTWGELLCDGTRTSKKNSSCSCYIPQYESIGPLPGYHPSGHEQLLVLVLVLVLAVWRAHTGRRSARERERDRERQTKRNKTGGTRQKKARRSGIEERQGHTRTCNGRTLCGGKERRRTRAGVSPSRGRANTKTTTPDSKSDINTGDRRRSCRNQA